LRATGREDVSREGEKHPQIRQAPNREKGKGNCGKKKKNKAGCRKKKQGLKGRA